MANYEIQKSLVISTAHISKRDNNLLTRDASQRNDKESVGKITQLINRCIVDSFPYGFYVYVPDKEEDDDVQKSELYSDAFKKLIRIAREQGCQYLKLDCDGQTYDELETFNW